MKNLSSRAASAIVAVIILIAALYFGKSLGIYALCLFVVARGSFEVARMFFSNTYPKFVKRLFVVTSILTFLLITLERLEYASNFGMIF